MAGDDILAVKRRYSAQLMEREGVEGFGIERDASGREILVLVVSTTDPALLAGLPRELDGHPVRIERGGPYRAFG